MDHSPSNVGVLLHTTTDFILALWEIAGIHNEYSQPTWVVLPNFVSGYIRFVVAIL